MKSLFGKYRHGVEMKRQLNLCVVPNADTRSGNILNFEKLLSSNRYNGILGVKPDAKKRKTVN